MESKHKGPKHFGPATPGKPGPQTKFTPGPWSIASHNGTDIGIVARKSGKGGQMVALAVLDEDAPQDGDEHHNNARLIAAAPDLYAACESLLTLLAYMTWNGGDIAEKAAAALAKARGE